MSTAKIKRISQAPVNLLGKSGTQPVHMLGRIEVATIIAGGEQYDGLYDVIPKAYEAQILETEGLIMRHDVNVEEIPIYKTTNPSGGYTVNIGG